MPENVKDRPTRSYEHVFLFSKSNKYYYDASAIAEPIAASTAARYMGGRSDSGKYSAIVPGQGNGKVQGINRPRKAGEIKKEDISPYRNSRDVWLVNTEKLQNTNSSMGRRHLRRTRREQKRQ